MDTRGKIWQIDDDQKLMESPHLSNLYFSQMMGRSENAIKCRRSHLAAKMHQNDPSTSLEEYVALMNGDLDHAAALLQEWSEKRANLKNFLDKNRKRKQEEMMADPPQMHGNKTSRFFGAAPPEPGASSSTRSWLSATTDERIETICQSIREEGGNLASVFNDPQFLPTIIRHYQGFEAYARVVQARIIQ